MSEVKKAMTITEKSTKALVTATGGLGKIMAELDALVATVPAIVVDIEVKQGELTAIQEDTKAAARKAKAELALEILENEDKVLAGLLKARGLAHVTVVELSGIKHDLDDARVDNATAIEAAVAQALATAAAENDAEVAKLVAAQSVETAQLKAQIESSAFKVEHLTKTVDGLNNIISEERTARVDVAKASQVQVIQQPAAK